MSAAVRICWWLMIVPRVEKLSLRTGKGYPLSHTPSMKKSIVMIVGLDRVNITMWAVTWRDVLDAVDSSSLANAK
ncbi:MAG: hypothetical protein A2896_00385 [Candidatus Nealsonbacteria bacterium RIFCSPLOWO2_01_FULL_43_32]|uniref:Uncharacterized protein n=1 Tax=Candidatus Nealsonbacteria bacterium RIFCSPLOWO2_01_FULL_43_32 TaxID=1801672 RepID=A0A1G2EGD3_9BACT|nr:MAG: hypothetical protein A2896_00385 [Candidatus Nealsonbacteria bacterium RIFCSPLOWO2_01_FULL_43_32]